MSVASAKDAAILPSIKILLLQIATVSIDMTVEDIKAGTGSPALTRREFGIYDLDSDQQRLLDELLDPTSSLYA